MDSKVTSLIEEYRIVSGIREGYMHAYTRTNFYLGMLLVALWAGIYGKVEESFLIIPFLLLIQCSIVQWNQYHHFLTEEYLIELENRINALLGQSGENGLHYYNYYKTLFDQTFLVKDKKTILPLIKPTAFLSVFLSLFNLSILIYSMVKAYVFLRSIVGAWAGLSFVALVGALSFLLFYNFLLLPKNIRPLLCRILKNKE